ncbi:exosome non-catalytic core subunit rrp40 [Dinochytrium kinnereticum]|nr:exosome non-catalytic core subunit rrp40 [Dinochytrium kinnereticum]
MTILPGDAVPVTTSDGASIKLGPGLRQEIDGVAAIKAGVLRRSEGGERVWLESSQKRYVPQLGESVIGVVTGKQAESYRVDIGGAHAASLGVLAFENATKRNKPNLEVNTLVYARVSLSNKDMEPEIECFNPSNGKADGFGELKGGFMFKGSLSLCRSLLTPGNLLLDALSKLFSFELAVGMNGRVWVNADSTLHTVALVQALKGSEGLHSKNVKDYVKTVAKFVDKAKMDIDS